MNHSNLTKIVSFAILFCLASHSQAQSPFLEFRYQFDTDAAPLIDTSGKELPNLGMPSNGEPHRLGEPSLVGGDGFSLGLDAPGDGHPTGSFITITSVPHPESFSFSIWIKPKLTGALQAIFARDTVWWPSPCNYYGLFMDGSQSLVWKTGGVETILTDPEVVAEDEVSHIVVTHLDSDGPDSGNADRSRIYVNGEMIGEMEDPEEVPSLDSIADANDIFSIVWLGTLSSQGGYWGEMDDFQLYSTELTAEQIAEMYASPGSLANFGAAVPFEITNVDSPAENQVSLSWNSKDNKTYTVEHSDDPGSFVWLELADGVESGGDETTYVDTTAGEVSERSYRIKEEG